MNLKDINHQPAIEEIEAYIINDVLKLIKIRRESK